MADAPTPAAPAAPAAPAPPTRRSPVPLIALCVVLGAGGIYGARQYLWGRTHVQTDDAYLTGNLIQVGPVIGGTLAEIPVAEGDSVEAGQVLVRLDSDSQSATVRQAEAALATARSQVPQAEANLIFQQQTTAAAIQRAEAARAVQQARTQGAQAQVELTRKTTAGQVTQAQKALAAAQAQAAQVAAQAAAAQATVHQVVAQLATAKAGLVGAQKAIETAQRGVAVVSARLPGVVADGDRASRDEKRYRALLEKEAVTRQQYESVHAQAETARSSHDALREQIHQAESQVAQAEAQAEQARAQVAALEAQVQQARAAQKAAEQAATAAAEQVQVARAGVGVAQAGTTQVPIQASNFAATAAQSPQVAADLGTALAGRAQVAQRQEAVQAAKTQVAQAEAALATARKTLHNTTLTAPTNGTVLKKMANVGASVGAGQTILTLTQGKVIWLTANFKETQVRDLRIGQPVEVHVDGLPDKAVIGHIAVIGEATGATVSLLPPDNATGNFTKVVQRIPVRIALEGDTASLRQGMSCVAIVDTADKSEHPERVPPGWDGRSTNRVTRR